MAETETAIAPRKGTKQEIQLAYDAILNGKVIPTGDPEAMSLAIAEDIRNAEDFESAFGEVSLPAWADTLLNTPVLVQDFKLNNSEYKAEENSGSSVYAVCDLTRLDTGEQVRCSCGGRNVLVQLVKMLEMGWMDRPVKLVAKSTASGYDAYRLVKADA